MNQDNDETGHQPTTLTLPYAGDLGGGLMLKRGATYHLEEANSQNSDNSRNAKVPSKHNTDLENVMIKAPAWRNHK